MVALRQDNIVSSEVGRPFAMKFLETPASFSSQTSMSNIDESDVDKCDAYENKVVADALYRILGQRYLSLSDQIIWGSIYSLLLVTGVLGNLSTCIVITRNKYMHTATNMYLFNLAVSDLITLLCGLPFELANTLSEQYPFKFGSFFCSSRTILAELSAYVSVLTITSFTVERYIAICHPLRAQTFSNFRRSMTTILVVWLVSILCALPQGISNEVLLYVEYPNATLSNFTEQGCPMPLWNGSHIPDSLVCAPKPGDLPRFFINVSAFLFFFIPMGFISTLYVLIGIRLYRSGITRHVGGHEEKHKSRRMLIRMLVAVVCAFFICMAPFHLQRLISIYWSEPPPALMLILFYLTGSLFYVSCTLNPVLYNLMSAKFRHAFRQTLECCLPKSMRSNEKRMYKRKLPEASVLEFDGAVNTIKPVKNQYGGKSYLQNSTTMNSVISTRFTTHRSSRLVVNGTPLHLSESPSCHEELREELELSPMFNETACSEGLMKKEKTPASKLIAERNASTSVTFQAK